jgi:centrosomal protein CEP41
VKTGTTTKDINLVSDQLAAKRKGEKYKRIKCSTLAKLMTETSHEESIYKLNEAASQMDTASVGQEESLQGLLGQADTKSQVSMASLQSNATAVSAVTYATDQLGITD